MHMDIEWDPAKGAANLEKHGVTFEEASTVLLDPMALAQEDALSVEESRWVVIGMSARTRLLTVVYTLRREERIRYRVGQDAVAQSLRSDDPPVVRHTGKEAHLLGDEAKEALKLKADDTDGGRP